MIEIVSLTGAFSDACEDGVASVGLGDVVDQFLDDHSFADTCTAEETNFTSSCVGGKKIDHLDTGDEDLSSRALFVEGGGFTMDGISLFGGDGSSFVDGVADDVHDAAEGFWTHGDTDWCASINYILSSNEAFGGIHSDGSDSGVSEMLGDF